jgi:hypothetical protein
MCESVLILVPWARNISPGRWILPRRICGDWRGENRWSMSTNGLEAINLDIFDWKAVWFFFSMKARISRMRLDHGPGLI